ncbi:MAG: glycosyltransferase family 2 protein [Gemmatimonadales bacterium]
MPAPITVVIPTRNEGDQIAACVRHLAWADEVLVADGGSTDGTVALARADGATVLDVPGVTIAAQRNAAIGRARNTWVFALDADERIGPELAREIVGRAADSDAHEAYAVRRNNVYLGRTMRYAGWGNSWAVRFFRRDRRFVEKRVHEGLEPVSNVGRLVHPLEHTPYRDLAHHVQKLVRYAEWGAQDLRDAGRRAGVADVVLRPPWTLFRTYVLQLGVLEGWRGIVLCGLASVSVFLKYARLWDLERHP